MENFEYTPKLDVMLNIISNLEDINNEDGVFNDIYTTEGVSQYADTLIKLGLISKDALNNYVLIDKGWNIATSNTSKSKALLYDIIQNHGLVASVVKYAKEKSGIFSVLDLRQNIFPDDITDITIKVILAWLIESTILIDNGESYEYNNDYNIDEYHQEEPQKSIYPLSYTVEIDIKEDKYSVFEYLRKIDSNSIIMNPDFQRNLVWKVHQKSQFIESLILNIPIPPIYLKKTIEGKLIIIDGLQRTTTLIEFLENKFTLSGLDALSELNDLRFSDIANHCNLEIKNLKTRIEDKQLLFYILQPSVPMPIVYDIFNRINTGGTKLERQEIRNCIFIGNATRLLKHLSKDINFKNAIGKTGISSNRMKDREAILRCIAFDILSYESDYKNSMDDFLEKAMIKINLMDDDDISTLADNFIEVMKISYAIFGENNFRIFTESTKGRVNIAVMESIYHFIKNNDIEQSSYDTIRERYKLLLKNQTYIDAVRFSTGSPNRVKNRFEKANKILSGDNHDK